MIPRPKLSAATLAEGIAAPHSRTIFVVNPSRATATVDGLTIHRSEMCTHAPIIASGMKSRLHPGSGKFPQVALYATSLVFGNMGGPKPARLVG